MKDKKISKKVLFTATVDKHILHFHIPYLKMFKENGYEVHVATNGNENIPYCDVKHKISFERSPVKYNNIVAIRELKKVIDSEKFDLIHCHTPMGSVVTRIAAINARNKYGTKVYYTAHGFHFYKGASVLNWLLFYPIENFLSRFTDVLITINNEDFNLAKNKFHAKDTRYVPGIGIDLKKYNVEIKSVQASKLKKDIGISDNDFTIIYVAELNKNKNQIMIIEAVRKLLVSYKNIKLLLIGDGDFKEYYESKINEYELDYNIKFLGYRSDVPNLFKISNMAVSTSKREGLPLNIIEAMAAGLPIVVTNCRGNRDLVENSINGYTVDIGDTKQLEKCIENIIQSKDIQRKFKYNNIERTKKYDIEKIMQDMKEIYNIE